ncbi:hypothetical protein NDU88_011931 [Pleurodeles waltl]|uniref:Uncharacterized protein n=1 Tax=Pleurodeles waltl TaxID=8319 RepID=A0AAV7R2I8_PLEWA|nr:hypothetical protein NDU88_011931 [Pleurodeles waltl]
MAVADSQMGVWKAGSDGVDQLRNTLDSGLAYPARGRGSPLVALLAGSGDDQPAGGFPQGGEIIQRR